jgi:chromosome segregation ATPase
MTDDDDDADDARDVVELRARVRTLEEIVRTLGARAARLDGDAKASASAERQAMMRADDAERAVSRETQAKEACARALEAERERADVATRAKEDAEREARRAKEDARRCKEARNAARDELKQMQMARGRSVDAVREDWVRREEELTRRCEALESALTSTRAENEELRRRATSAETHVVEVNRRITETERDLEAMNDAIVHATDDDDRAREDRLVELETTRAELERTLMRVTAEATTASGELEKLRIAVNGGMPELANLRAQLDAKEVRERDLVAALRYEERLKDEAIREMHRARAAASKAEAYASKLSAKSSQTQALATVIQSLGDSLFDG